MLIERGSVVTITAGQYAGFPALVTRVCIPVVTGLSSTIPVVNVRILFASGDLELALLPNELELKANDLESRYQFERLAV